MNPLSYLRWFIKGIVKENSPSAIALAIAFGFVIGIIPKSNLTAQSIFILAMVIRTNTGFLILSILIFSFISPVIDPLTDRIGYFILTLPSLNKVFNWMYNTPVIAWSDFNNTVVMGGVVVGLILFLPVYYYSKKFGVYYNSFLKEKIAKSRVSKVLKASWLFEWYFK